jgi:hypothetical protein
VELVCDVEGELKISIAERVLGRRCVDAGGFATQIVEQ